MSDTLHMVRLALHVDGLVTLGRRRHLPIRHLDEGYIVHCLLGELFGERAPKPFAIVGHRARLVDVLAYSFEPAAALMDHAQAFADPSAYNTVDWQAIESKPMPASFRAGRRVGFEIRLCPTIRKHAKGAKHRKGAEVDVFVARCWDVGAGMAVSREDVYVSWLDDQLDRHGGCRLDGAALRSFQLSRLLRRRTTNGTRHTSTVQRPDARITGTVTVVDGARFHSLLTRGVGRHRAFGFGMMLLRPPGEARC